MPGVSLLIFDDGRGDFGPLTDLRAAFDLRTGAVTTRERIERVTGRTAKHLWVPAELQELAAAPGGPAVNRPLDERPWLAVNGRWTATAGVTAVRELQPGAAVVQADGQVVAACPRPDQVLGDLLEGSRDARDLGWRVQHIEGQALLARPWDILTQLEAALRADLAAGGLPKAGPAGAGAVGAVTGLKPGGTAGLPGVTVFGEHAVSVAASARVQPGVVINAEGGPVAIDEGALVMSLAYLEGPCYLGRQAVVAAHTYLRPNTVIGPACKAAGELSHSILQGYSNKAHYGYLGHSLVGQWVNLGAGTVVSNLKNTYGNVRVQLRAEGPAEDTGRMNQGPIIGDHVRTAIGTRLLTGAVVATGTMLALSGFAPKVTRALGFYTDEHPEGEPTQMEKFLETVRAMMGRRKVELGAAEETRLRELAADERG